MEFRIVTYPLDGMTRIQPHPWVINIGQKRGNEEIDVWRCWQDIKENARKEKDLNARWTENF